LELTPRQCARRRSLLDAREHDVPIHALLVRIAAGLGEAPNQQPRDAVRRGAKHLSYAHLAPPPVCDLNGAFA
jgi:hypothetical protein